MRIRADKSALGAINRPLQVDAIFAQRDVSQDLSVLLYYSDHLHGILRLLSLRFLERF
jgi:hypothetical protein